MLESVVGIADIESKVVNTARGEGTLYIVKDATGLEYTTFDRELAVLASGYKGQNVTIGYDEATNTKNDRNGIPRTYINRYLKSVKGAATASELGGAIQKAQYAHTSDKDGQIARAVALKGAVELAAGGVLDRDEIVNSAKYFEAYLLTGDTAGNERLLAAVAAAPEAYTTSDDIPFMPTIDGLGN